MISISTSARGGGGETMLMLNKNIFYIVFIAPGLKLYVNRKNVSKYFNPC